MSLSSEELHAIKILKDPVLWAETTLRDPKHSRKPLKLRDYQITMLRDKSKRKVSRCGRRIGKCKSRESEIMTTNGPIRVEDLFKMKDRPPILTFNEDTQQINTTKDYFIFENGIKSIYKITTSTGRVNYATGNHPYLTLDIDGSMNWIEIDNMQIGDRIAIPSTYENLIEGTRVGPEISRFLGYLCGDGGTSTLSHIGFTNFDNNVIKDLDYICNHLDFVLQPLKAKGEYSITKSDKSVRKSPAITLCEEHNLMGKLAIDKEAPPSIMAGTPEDIAHFLAAYWDCDGWCSIQNKTYDKLHRRPRVEVGCCSSSEKLARDIQHLLLRLGIVSRLKKKKVKYKGEYRSAWQVTIGDSNNITSFSEKIQLVSEKRNKLNDILKLLEGINHFDNNELNTVPKEIWSYIKNKQQALGLSNMQVCGAENREDNKRLRSQYSVSRNKIRTYANSLKDEYLQKLSDNNILWDKVISIEHIGEDLTYDLTVPETHTFIADDIISHNSLVMTVHMLWYAFTHENSKQVIATPYESQVRMIFEMLRAFIDGSQPLGDSVASITKNPFIVKFKNGATISGFTAGTKAGNSGGSLRGQAADWLYMDKMKKEI